MNRLLKLCLVLITVSCVNFGKDEMINENTIVRDGMTIKSIMNDFVNLTYKKAAFEKTSLQTIENDFDEIINLELIYYLKNYTPSEEVSFQGESIMTYPRILESIAESWQLKQLLEFQLIPISEGNSYDYTVVDIISGKTYTVASKIFISRDEIQAFDWKKPRSSTKKNLLEAASEEYEVYDNIFDRYITYLIDLESDHQ